MVAAEDSNARRGKNGDGKVNGADLGDSDIDSLFAHTRTELTNLFDSLKGIAFVEWQVIRLRAIDTFFRGVFFLSIAGFALAASIAAALFVVEGVRGAVRASGTAGWIGDLGGGAIGLALVAILAFTLRAVLRKRVFWHMKRRFSSREEANDGAQT